MSINGTSFSGGARRRREAREGGMAVMMTALMLLFTIPTIGLAIDAGLLYVIRGRLTAACDAAALATARNLNMGQTLSEQAAAATVRGNAFFSANFPASYLGTTGTTNSIEVAQTSMSTLTVTTTATTNAPLYFMRLLGGTTAVAGAIGKASRRDVNLMLVLDRSGSMTGTPCADMIAASKTFVNMFVNGRDTLGLVTFGSSVFLAYPLSNNFRTTGALLTSEIDLITCTGGTNTSDSYMTAYNQLVALNEPLALNMIVFFTDGYPTAFTANFPVKTVSDTRYGAGGLGCGTGSQCTVPKSTCVDDLGLASSNASWGTFSGKAGAIAAASPSGNATGNTLGLMTRTATSSSSGDVMASATVLNGCAMASSWARARQDLAYVPDTDINGLSTAGYRPVSTYPGTNPDYSGRKRIDTPINIQNIAMNLADNAAATARGNSTINVVTYTLGLGGNGGVDEVLLKRMANDPLSDIFDNTKPEGLYVYAPNSAALNSAFARIAGEILRLAQ